MPCARPDRRRPVTARILLGTAAAVAALGLLAGCTAARDAPADPAAHTTGSAATPQASPGAASTPAGEASPVPSSPPATPATPQASTAPAVPAQFACSKLITDQQLYAFNPNVSADPHAAPEGTLVTRAVRLGGTACTWTYDSSNAAIQFAVATPPAATLATLEDEARRASTSTAAYGSAPAVHGYFTVAGSRGQVQVFTRGHWIVGHSSTFFVPGDAAQPVQDILGNLGLG